MARCKDGKLIDKKQLKQYIKSIKPKGVTVENKTKRTKGDRFENIGQKQGDNSLVIKLFTNKYDTVEGKDAKSERDAALVVVKARIMKDKGGVVPAVWDKVKGIANLDMAKVSLFHFNNEEGSQANKINALEIYQRGIAFDHIFSSIKSEYDLMDKHNLSEEQIKSLLPPGEIVPPISAIGNLAAIGRELAYTQGINLVPDRKGKNSYKDQMSDIERMYSEMGLKAVQELEKEGFVTIEYADENGASGNTVNRNFKKYNGSFYAPNTKIIKSVVIRINMDKIVKKARGVSMTKKEVNKLKHFLKQDLSSLERKEIEDMLPMVAQNLKAAKMLRNLVVPSSLQTPDIEFEKGDRKEEDVRTDQTTKDVLDQKEEGALKFAGYLEPIAEMIHDKMKSGKGMTFKQAARAIFGESYRDIMGFTEENMSSRATIESDRGRALSKSIPTADFFENYGFLKGESLFLHELNKRNGRGHYSNTVMNPQTDKHFSRFVLGIPEYEIEAFNSDGSMTELMKHVLLGVQDQASDISIDEVLHAGINDQLDELLDYFAKAKKDPEVMKAFMSNGVRNIGLDLGGSIWQQMDTMSGIESVRNAVAGKGTTLTGTFMPKPDGTASGAVIMALQLAGKPTEKGDADLFTALGLNGSNGARDAYKFVEDGLINALKFEKQNLSEMAKTIKFLVTDSGIYNNLRDISKPISMPIMYSQGEDSSIETVAEEFTDKFYRKMFNNPSNKMLRDKAIEWIKIVDEELYNEVKDMTVKELVSDKYSNSVYYAIKSYMEEHVAKDIYNLTQETFTGKYLSNNNIFIKEMFKKINNVTEKTGERVQMVPPMTYYNAVVEKNGGPDKFDPANFEHLTDEEMKAWPEKGGKKKRNLIKKGIPLMKLFESVRNVTNVPVAVKYEFNHEVNAKVNIVHAIDFAILTEAFKRTFAEAKTSAEDQKGAMATLDLVANGTISVHDAIAAHPEFSQAFEKHYRKAALDINAVYDIQDQLAYTYSQLRGVNKADAAKERKGTQKNLKAKADALKTMDWDSKKIFGFDKKKLDGINVNRNAESTYNKEEAENQQEVNQRQQEESEQLSFNYNKTEAKEEYNRIEKLIKSGKPWFAIDTETNGKDFGKDTTQVIEITTQEMVGSETKGDPKTFYFKTIHMEEGAEKTHGYSLDDVGTNFTDQANEKGYNSNEAVMKALQDEVKGQPMVAYNSEFDSKAVANLNDRFASSESVELNEIMPDALGAAVHKANTQGVPTEADTNKLKDMAERAGVKWDANEAHKAEYDVAQLVNVLKEAYSTEPDAFQKRKTNDGKLYAPKKKPKKKKSIGPTNLEPLSDILSRIREKSEVLDEFLKRKNTKKIKWDRRNSTYDPSEHTISLLNDARMGDESLIRALEHEIRHYDTTAFLYARPSDVDVVYLSNALDNLIEKYDVIKPLIKSKRGKELFDYMTTHEDSFVNLAEFVAVVGSEPEVLNEIAEALGSKTFKAKVLRLIRKIKKFFDAGDMSGPFNPEEIIDKVNEISRIGKSFNQTNAGEKARTDAGEHLNSLKKNALNAPKKGSTKGPGIRSRGELAKQMKYTASKTGNESNLTDPVSAWARQANDLAADLLWNKFGETTWDKVAPTFEAADEYLYENSDVYKKVKDNFLNVWESRFMEQMKAYLVPSTVGDRSFLQGVAGEWQKASKEAMKLATTEVSRVDSMLKGMSNDEIADLNSIFARAPIFMLMRNDGLLYNISTGKTTINEEIKALESKAKPEDLEIAKELTGLFMHGKSSKYYNIKSIGLPVSRIRIVEQLTALYSANEVKNANNIIRDIRTNNKELFDALSNRSTANDTMVRSTYEEHYDNPTYRGNMTAEYYKVPIETKAVSQEDMSKNEYQHEEWKVAVRPEDNYGYAVMWRKVEGKAYQEGFGTNIDYANTEVYMPPEFKPKKSAPDGLIPVGNGSGTIRYKVPVPHKMKQEMGLIENPAHTLVRSYAHANQIHMSKAIRDEIMNNSGVREYIPSTSDVHTRGIVKLIKEGNKEEPYFIGLPKDVLLKDLPAEIRKKYQVIDTRMSGVGGFASKVKLVRNDIAPWMVGYQRKLPFDNTPGLRKAFSIAQQAISLLKIHMIIINPAKVALDAISTTTLLMSNGVPPLEILRGWKKNVPLMADYAKISGQYVNASLLGRGGDKQMQKKAKELEKEMKEHPLAGAMAGGVMQSLSTDIMIRDLDTITGLQHNMEKFFESFTTKDNGDLNQIGSAIMKLAKAGINIENVMEGLAKMTENSESLELITDELREMGKRMDKMKSNDEIGKYLSEYFGSPASNMTRLGSIATMYPDTMSRIVYRDYLIKNWGNEAKKASKDDLSSGKITEAEYKKIVSTAQRVSSESDMSINEISLLNAMVSDFMPDYLYAPPMELDIAGRWFVTPFVTFSSRIQRVIYNLVKRNPLTMIGSLVLMEEMGMSSSNTPYHVVGSNYLTRDEFLNDVIDDLFSTMTILPTNALNFDIVR